MCLPAEIKQLMESSSLENYGYQIIYSMSPISLYLFMYVYVYKKPYVGASAKGTAQKEKKR